MSLEEPKPVYVPAHFKTLIGLIRVSLVCSSTGVVDEADLLVGGRWRVRRVPWDVVGPLHHQQPGHHVDEDLPGPRGHSVR